MKELRLQGVPRRGSWAQRRLPGTDQAVGRFGTARRAGTEGRDGTAAATATSRPVPPELGTDRSASAEL